MEKFRQFRTLRLGGKDHRESLRCGGIVHAHRQVETNFITPQYALVYIFKGSGTFTSERGKVYKLAPDTVFQRFPGVPHRAIFAPGTYSCYIAVPAALYRLITVTGFPLKTDPVFSVKTELPEEKINWHDFFEIGKRLEGISPEKLIYVLNDMQKLILRLHSQGLFIKTEEFEFIREAKRILEKEAASRKSLERIAAELGMKYNTFRKYYSDITGESPGGYQIKIRIEKGAELLEATELTIGEISEILGYNDIFAFSSQFKKKTGISPRTFRRDAFHHSNYQSLS
jgi:AraC family transcriptional regulator, arabinose operon regulatory protein